MMGACEPDRRWRFARPFFFRWEDRVKSLYFYCCVALLWAAACHDAPAVAEESPLDAYVAAKDDSYGWVKRQQGSYEGCEFAELTLTSQTWREIVWKHQLFVLKPNNVRDGSRAILFISGGGWRDELARPPQGKDELPKEAAIFAALAKQARAPVAILKHVPQQPIFGDMVEDEIISYTFEQFIRTKDATWPLLLPMVKSAVRGMDAVQEFSKSEWQLDVERFTVTGASKRGWTTWLTSAVDKRVERLAPMVIDVLNMGLQMKHQLATWGKFSEQIEDYTRRGIQEQFASEGGQTLNRIVDPYHYRDRIRQPKLIMLGTNDRYWTVDALNLYWDGLTGEKHVLYVPNKGHSLGDMERVVGSLAAFHREAAGEIELPNLSWDLVAGNPALTLTVRSSHKPEKMLAWIAASDTRDFRDATWTSHEIEAANDAYTHRLPLPTEGYAAMFGEGMFEQDGTRFFLSTTLKVVGPKGEIVPDGRATVKPVAK